MSYHNAALLAFKRVPILSTFTDEEIFDFVRLCNVRQLRAGEMLFEQGSEGTSLYIIESGVLDVYLVRETGREHIAEYGAWDVVGEIALLDPAPRSATVAAREPCTLYEVKGADFERMLQEFHPAAFKLVRGVARLICQRIRWANTRLEAELSGSTKPPPYTGEYERVRESASHIAVGPGRPRVMKTPAAAVPAVDPRDDGAGGVVRRVLKRLWAPEAKPSDPTEDGK